MLYCQLHQDEGFVQTCLQRADAVAIGEDIMITGSCLCQGIKFRVSGKLGPAVFCHCRQCQKSNGTAFATTAPVRARYFEITEGRELVREYESSPGKFRAFCSICGSPLYSRRPAEPDTLRLRLGTLDDDPGRRPLVHVWTGAKAPWFDITDALPQHEAGGPSETRKPGD
jgi:hypothetical protein